MTESKRSSGGLDDRRKRLLFRCWHRGTREMDLILGRFADVEIANLPDGELDQLERLIEVPDPDLYAALIGDKPLGPEHTSPLLTASRHFAPWNATHEIFGQIACRHACARPCADLRQCRRGRRRARGVGSRARGRRPAETARGEPRGGMPRRSADAADCTGAGILRARPRRRSVSGLGLPTL